jgi:hypothetical protein
MPLIDPLSVDVVVVKLSCVSALVAPDELSGPVLLSKSIVSFV